MTSWPYQGGQEKTSLLPLKNMAILFGTPKYCYATLSAFAFPRQTETANSVYQCLPIVCPYAQNNAGHWASLSFEDFPPSAMDEYPYTHP